MVVEKDEETEIKSNMVCGRHAKFTICL